VATLAGNHTRRILMLICPTCNIDYEEGKKFCKHCGTALVRTGSPTLARPAEDPNWPGVYFGPPKQVYAFLLSKLEAEGGNFVNFRVRDRKGDRFVDVFFDERLFGDPSGRRYTLIHFAYPYDEEPGSLLPRRGVSFPAGYDLWEFTPGDDVNYKGPKCSHSELADTIDALFTRLMGAPPDYVVQGYHQAEE